MSFTQQNVAQMGAAMKKAAGALLMPQDVDLYQGATVSVKLHVSVKRAGQGELTAGATMETGLVATIDADDFKAKAGRGPQLGDRIHWADRKYAVRDVHIAAPAGVPIFYKCELDG